MADPILMFPRVVIKYIDPTFSDNKDLGYIDGNIWINKQTDTIFLCIDAISGTWITLLASGSAAGGGNLSFGDGVDSNVDFDLGDGTFTVNASNIILTDDGNLHLKGGQIEFFYDRTGDPTEFSIVKVERGDEDDASIKWSEDQNAWLAGTSTLSESSLYPIMTVVSGLRDPLPSNYTGHFIGQTWINLVTQQKFTCMARDILSETSSWRLELTTAPTKFTVEYDDHLILYGVDDETFMKISVTDFSSFIQDVVGGFGLQIPGYAWVVDAVNNITFSDEDPIDNGFFETDVDGNVQPIEGTDVDMFFELDENDDIMAAIVDAGSSTGSTGLEMVAVIVVVDTTLVSGNNYLVDGDITVTLPLNPDPGDMISLMPGNDWASHPLTVGRNGQRIMAIEEDLICDTRVEFLLVFKDTANGWIVVD